MKLIPALCVVVSSAFAIASAHAQSVQYRSPAGIEYRSQADTGPVARATAALNADPRNVQRIIALGVAQSGARQFREAIETFTRSHCGLVSDAAACACHRRVLAAVQLGRVQPNQLVFADAGSSFAEARELIRDIDEVKRVVELHRGTRPRGATLDFTRRVVSALDVSRG